jgi:hypothetical protein
VGMLRFQFLGLCGLLRQLKSVANMSQSHVVQALTGKAPFEPAPPEATNGSATPPTPPSPSVTAAAAAAAATEAAYGRKSYPWEGAGATASAGASHARTAAHALVLECLRRDPAARPDANHILKAVDRIGSAAAAEGASASVPLESTA